MGIVSFAGAADTWIGPLVRSACWFDMALVGHGGAIPHQRCAAPQCCSLIVALFAGAPCAGRAPAPLRISQREERENHD